MHAIAIALTALVALLHLYFLVLEMFLWTRPLGLRTFRNTPEKAETTKVLAANQGLYNGFLAAGLLYGLATRSLAFCLFFLGCVVVAGLYGAWSVNKRIFFVQALPAIRAARPVVHQACGDPGDRGVGGGAKVVSSVDNHFAKLVGKCAREEHVEGADIDELCALSGFTRSHICDLLSAYIANEFASERLSFEDADAVANFLWSESAFGLSGFAKDVFIAFDDGEYLSTSDPDDTDPVAKYTRPQIMELLARRPRPA